MQVQSCSDWGSPKPPPPLLIGLHLCILLQQGTAIPFRAAEVSQALCVACPSDREVGKLAALHHKCRSEQPAGRRGLLAVEAHLTGLHRKLTLG